MPKVKLNRKPRKAGNGIYEKRDSLFQPTQTKSALKNFPIQYRIKGTNGYDPESFLLNSKQPTTNLMIQKQY